MTNKSFFLCDKETQSEISRGADLTPSRLIMIILQVNFLVEKTFLSKLNKSSELLIKNWDIWIKTSFIQINE